MFNYYFSYFFSWFVFYFVQDLIRILESFDVMSPSASRGANAETSYILDGLNKCGHFGWTCCFPAPWRNNIHVWNKYIFETWIANISQQCHNKFVSIKTGGGHLPVPYWVTGVLLYSQQQNKKHGREGKDEEKHSQRRRKRGMVNMGVIGGHGERDGGRRAAVFWLLSKGSIAPCEQTNTGQLNITFPCGAWALWTCAGLERAEQGMLCACEMTLTCREAHLKEEEAWITPGSDLPSCLINSCSLLFLSGIGLFVLFMWGRGWQTQIELWKWSAADGY